MKTKKLRGGSSGSGLQGHRSTGGFSLVEVVLAIGVVAFCLLVLIALIPLGITGNKASRDRTLVADLCSSIESDLRSTPPTSTKSPLYQISFPTATTATSTTLYDTYLSGTPTLSTTRAPGSQYRFTITLTPPSSTSPNDPVFADILATWPAPAAVTSATSSVNVCVAINRVGS